MTHTAHHFAAQLTHTARLDYLLYLPPNYNANAAERWPLILFLHGSGERGSDLDLIKQHGLPRNLEEGKDIPFIVISPQCPADSHWTLHPEALYALLNEVIAQHQVDERRIYLTGLSMGGSGSWILSASHPDRFAAVAPIAGRIVPLPLIRLKTLPLWVFHGDLDERAPISETRRTVAELQDLGGPVELTVYPGVGHDSWTQTYNNPDLYTWFLSHTRP